MLGYSEIVKKLRKIKKRRYIKTHRKGPTGIGKTLEDLLGIKENNIPGPNGHMIELKSARKGSKSMLTLFTKSPLPKKANSVLLGTFGYPSPERKGEKVLHTTVNATSYNKLKGNKGFKIYVKGEKVALISKTRKILGYWDKKMLKKCFEHKLPALMYVQADTRTNASGDEEFWFNEAWFLKEFNFRNFVKLLKEGVIVVDIRIGQYPDGRPHDHGTGFRVFPDKLELCFSNRKRIM